MPDKYRIVDEIPIPKDKSVPDRKDQTLVTCYTDTGLVTQFIIDTDKWKNGNKQKLIEESLSKPQ